MEVRGEQEVRAFLEARGVEAQIYRFEDSTENSLRAAEALGVELGQIVKSVLFLADDEPVLVLMSGDMNVNNKKLKKLLGARKAKIADPESVVAVTGYLVGAVPPVAHRRPLRIFLDVSLQRFGKIYPAAGTTHNMFATTFAELAELTGAQLVDLAVPKKKGAQT